MGITQIVEVIDERDKTSRLNEILKNCLTQPRSKILIFVATKRGCDRLAQDLNYQGYQAVTIHGDKKQSERDWVLKDFRNGRSQIMIATDVAARGLDVKDIGTVINFDFPGQVEDYVHRIGRTGRAGTKGKAFSFFTQDKFKLAGELVSVMKEASQEFP